MKDFEIRLKKIQEKLNITTSKNVLISDEIDALKVTVPFDLPEWYIYFLKNTQIIGCSFDNLSSNKDEEFYDLEILDFIGIYDEIEIQDEEKLPLLFKKDMIPFANDNGGGDYYFLQLHEDITKTKVIQNFHDSLEENRLVCSNFMDFLEKLEIND